MGKTTEAPPPLEEIDSPDHERIARTRLVISVKHDKDYTGIKTTLSTYGKISLESDGSEKRSTRPGIGRYFIVTCTPGMAKKLRADYELNGAGPLKSIKDIRTIPESYEEWF